MSMSELELVNVIDNAEANGIQNRGDQSFRQVRVLKDYNGEPYEDEVEDRSRTVARSVSDLVESDMPALMRVFVGAGDPVEFQPTKSDPAAILEAEEKQRYVSYIIKTVEDSYITQHDWLKSMEFYDYGMVEYGLEDVEKTETKNYTGLSAEELALLVQDLAADPKNAKVEVTEKEDIKDKDGGVTFDIEFKIDREFQQWFLRHIPIEDTIISANAKSKNDAEIVGKRFRKSRGDLIEEGFDKELVMSLPTSDGNHIRSDNLKAERFAKQGGLIANDTALSEMNQEVEGMDVYVRVDFDEDGILERRHVIKVGNEILVNEEFDHIPYAISTAIRMPDVLAGKGRAELSQAHQRTETILRRNTLDNIYSHSYPRNVLATGVDEDDYQSIRLGGYVRTDAETAVGQVVPIVTEYIGGEILQVIQYLQGQNQLSTGTHQGNQALTADHLHKETATRFEGMERAAAGKLELVVRNHAEMGYRDLYEGIAWFASHFQDSKLEIYVLGKELTVNPANWRFEHNIVAAVGTGAGDDEKTIESLSALYQVQTALKLEGSELVDSKKLYNTLAKITRTIGEHKVPDYFNDPEKPAQTLQAQNELLTRQVQEMKALQNNPLAEAEQVKADAAKEIETLKAQLDMQKTVAKMQQDQQQFQETLRLDYAKLAQKSEKDESNTSIDVAKLELKHNTDLPGGVE